MAAASVTYNFTPSTTIVAAQVNQNFTDIVNFLNTQAMHKDGSVAFTAVPSGPAVDPSTSNHLVRKAYIDAKLDGAWTSYTPLLTAATVGNGTVVGKYKLIGDKTCLVKAFWTLGSTSSITGDVAMQLPFMPAAGQVLSFAAYGLDSGTKHFHFTGACNSGQQYVFFVTDTGTAANVVNPTNPFAWGTADQIGFSGLFEIA